MLLVGSTKSLLDSRTRSSTGHPLDVFVGRWSLVAARVQDRETPRAASRGGDGMAAADPPCPVPKVGVRSAP